MSHVFMILLIEISLKRVYIQSPKAVSTTITIKPIIRQMATVAIIAHVFMLASLPSSKFCIHSRVLFLSDRLIFFESTLKFLIWGTYMLLYSAWVSKNSGIYTHLINRSRPSMGTTISEPSELSDEELEYSSVCMSRLFRSEALITIEAFFMPKLSLSLDLRF